MHAGKTILLVFVLSMCPGWARGQAAAKYVTPEFGNSYALAAQPDNTLAVRIPVRGDPEVTVANLAISLLDVAVDSRHDPTLVRCITPALDVAGAALPAIVLTVTCEPRPHDAYEVTLAVSPKPATKPAGRPQAAATQPAGRGRGQRPAPDAAPQQMLAIKLTRPAPVLRPIAGQAVDRVVVIPFRMPAIAPSRLVLSETSGHALPVTFSAIQVDPATIDARPVAGRLGFSEGTTDEHGHAQLALRVDEEFPLGKARTTVEIRARELAAPLYVSYDVVTRLHGWMVLPAIVLGLVLGYLTRTVLKTFIERGTAKIAALDLLDRMQTADQHWKDRDFQTTTQELMAVLRDDIARSAAPELKTAVTTTDAAFTVVLSAVKKRAADTLQSIDVASGLTRPDAPCPGAIATVLAAADRTLVSARLQVLKGDVDGASAALRNATQELGKNVEQAAADWRARVQNALATLSAGAPLPPALQVTLSTASDAIAEQIAALPGGSLTPNVAALLQGVHTIRFLAQHDVVQRVLTPLSAMATEVVELLRNAAASAPTIEPARAALEKELAEDVDVSLEVPATAAAALLDALKKDITAAANAANLSVDTELSAGRYVAAAEIVAGVQNVAAGPPAVRRPNPAGADVDAVPALKLHSHPSTPLIFAAHEPVEVARARTFSEILAAKLVQFSTAAVGIAIVGLIMLLPTFDGTLRGILVALVWGYAGDISIDALTDTAKKAK